MKKTLLLGAIAVVAFTVSGCGSSKDTTNTGSGTDTTDTATNNTFGIASCDKYVKLMDCVVSKTPEASRADAQSMYDQAISTRKSLPADQLQTICDQTVVQLEAQKDTFAALWCEL